MLKEIEPLAKNSQVGFFLDSDKTKSLVGKLYIVDAEKVDALNKLIRVAEKVTRCGNQSFWNPGETCDKCNEKAWLIGRHPIQKETTTDLLKETLKIYGSQIDEALKERIKAALKNSEGL